MTSVARGLTAVMGAVTMAIGLLTAFTSDAALTATGAAGCTLMPTSGTTTRVVEGRHYYLNVPSGLPGPSAPLLLSLHGGTQPPFVHELNTDWSEVAKARHFIVAYPMARGLIWKDTHQSEDVTYLRNVIRDISSMYCVNPRQVYVAGYSSGAFMSSRLACDESAVIASVAVYAGEDPTVPTRSPCDQDLGRGRPIAVGIFHGKNDDVVPYRKAEVHRDNWLTRDGCPDTPTTETGVVVEASVYAEHTDITSRMREFFLRHPLPGA